MAKATHRPPARVRYEQSHPTVSFRLSRDVYDLLKQRLEDLGGISFADFVKESLGLLQLKMPDIEEIKERHGVKAMTRLRRTTKSGITVCQERIEMSPNGNDHKAMIGYMREHGWGHASCHGH